MSGNNPNILYSLNVLGNATVQGILDCTEVAIDNVVTENVETDSLTVNGPAAIAGTSTANTSVLTVASASTTATNVASFLAPAASPASIIIGQGTGGSQHSYIASSSNTMKLGVAGNDEAITLTNLGDVTVRNDLTVSGLTASLPVSTNASKKLVSASVTGTGSTVLQTSPSLVTPDLGVASATSLSSGPVTVTGVSTANTSVIAATSASTTATNVASFLAPSGSPAGIIVGQGTGGSQHCYISHSGGGVMNLGIAGNTETLVLTGGLTPTATVKGKLIIETPSCYTYLSSSTTAITAGVPTNMLHWGVNGAAANSGDALTYDNGTGRFTNSLGRSVLAIITITARTDVQAGTLTASLESSSLSGGASVSTVQLGDYVALSASIVMGPAAYFSLQGIASVGAAWQTTGGCITITLF